MSKKPFKVRWRCHTPNLLKEIMHNPGLSILNQPIKIFASLLNEVAIRASQLNDPKLNSLMMRLTLYEMADPESKHYDKKLLRETLEANL